MSTTTIAVLIAFVCYLAMMIGIGIFSMKKTNSTEDYFLGGRGLNSWVAALSAQASDMSGWLLMGLPGSIYLKKKIGDTVKKGEPIAICYAGTKEKLNRGMAMFESSIRY